MLDEQTTIDIQKGDVIDAEIVDFGSNGEGIAKCGVYPIFIPFAVKGDVVRAKITWTSKDYAFGEIVELVEPSADRVKPKCPYFEKCGGCDLQNVSYLKQLEIKRENVRRALKKNGGIDVDVPTPVSLNEWEYRNKLALPFGKNKRSGRVYLGFFEKRSHSVVPMKWCALQGQWAADLIEDIGEWANECGLSVYDELSGKGYLRHAVARMLDTLTLTLVVNSKAQNIEKIDCLTQKLNRHFVDYTIFVSNNVKNTNVILGDNATLVYGKERPQNLGRYKAVVSPLSFLQVNDKVRDAIYDDVCEHIGSDFDGEIVELYSGVGLLTAQIALRLPKSKITAVEIVPEATKDADALMRNLALDNVKNVCADAAKFVENIEDNNTHRVLILDPPRKGCDERVLDKAKSAGFDKILYVSCNPQTLARDLKTLSSNYHIDYVQPYDMFPQTRHVEMVVSMTKNNLVKTIVVETAQLELSKLIALEILTAEDRAQAERFVQEKDKVAHLVSAYLKRKYVGEWTLTESGKPVSQGKHFNVSHCDGMVVLVLSDDEIGVDVENVRTVEDDLKRYVATDEEYEAIVTDKNFFEIWTAKESLAKADGEGLDGRVKDIPAFPLVGGKEFKGEKYFSNQIEIDKYIISVTKRGKEPFDILIKKEKIK